LSISNDLHLGLSDHALSRAIPVRAGRPSEIINQLHFNRRRVRQQVVMRQGMPFDVAVPNAQTRRAIEELENSDKRAKLKKHATTEAMLDDISGSRGNHAKKGT
jgi:hypothetical protein